MVGFSKLTAVLAIVALTLSGCNENFVAEDPNLLTADELRIRSIESQRKQTAVLVGAGAGALVGLIAKRNGSREEQLRAALIGGVIGGLAGFATGEYVNTRTRQFSSDQSALRSLLAAADRDIANYRGLNSTSARLIDQQRAKVRRLNRRLANGEENAESYRTKLASARTNVGSLDRGITDINKQIDVMKADRDAIQAARKSTGGLSGRISSLERQKRTLETRRRALANVYDEVPDSVGAYDF